MRIIKSWRSYNKSLGIKGFARIFGCAVVNTLLMGYILLILSLDGQLEHVRTHRIAAWVLCFPAMAADWLWPESWLPLALTIVFNLLVAYLVGWTIVEYRQFRGRSHSSGADDHAQEN
jgi:hypothetical protein